MNIRPATPADLKACAEVQVYSEKRGASARRKRAGLTLKYFKRYLADSFYTFLVAEQSGRVVGYIVLLHDEWNAFLFVEGLFVRQDSQKKGVGSALLAAADSTHNNSTPAPSFWTPEKNITAP